MNGISASDLFQASSFAVLCASVLFEYLLNLVTLDYMLLIMLWIVYHDVFVGGAVVFNHVGQLFVFAVYLFCILY